MNNMQIICENKELLYSNRICCFDNDSITFKYTFDPESVLTVTFNFNYDDKEMRFEISDDEKGHFTITTYNFNNTLGSGLKKPIEIATYKDKSIYCRFFIQKSKESNPILDFSLYLEV